MVSVKLLIPRKHAEAAQTTQYTVPAGTKTVIDKFTATNTSAAVVNFSVNLIAVGGVAADSNLVVKARPIAPGETYTCPELVGQVLDPGGMISTLASAVSSITVSAGGREIV